MTDEERLEGGLARLVVCIPKPAGATAFLRIVNLLVKELRRIDKLLNVWSIDRCRFNARGGNGSP